MSEQTNTQGTEERQGPPMPKWAYNIANPVLMAVLRSPLHRPLSDNLLILIFQGRKSGKRYMIPVGYMQEGSKLFVFSHSAWTKNFIGGAPVAVRLRGELHQGTARVTEDPHVIDTIIGRMISERGEEMAQRMGFLSKDEDGVMRAQAPKGTTYIEIELA
ncbi:MAG: hypothetical protein H7Z42_14740 [Roseiflexaceae bacterium]|nr:hypothetical protein [Roseiflexaceae bacterium]